MNRWLRGLGVVFVLMSANSAVFAVCDMEAEETIQTRTNACNFASRVEQSGRKFDCARNRKDVIDQVQSSLNRNLSGTSKESIQEDIAYAERYLTGIQNTPVGKFATLCPSDSHMECSRTTKLGDVASAKLNLCLARVAMARKTGEAISSNTSNQSQQNQAEDKLVTGPKEDCNALLRNVKTPEDANEHIACLRRNLSRSNNAEKAQSAQPSAATQQNQSAQQQSNQSQQTANQNQARADQARQGKRRRHEPENEAHQCLTVDATSAGFGSFVNKCNFKIAYSFCNYKPKKDSWAEFHNCEGRAGNSDFVGPNGTSAAHVKNTETVYFFACKDPSWSLDTEYVPGQGLRGRCYTVGGN